MSIHHQHLSQSLSQLHVREPSFYHHFVRNGLFGISSKGLALFLFLGTLLGVLLGLLLFQIPFFIPYRNGDPDIPVEDVIEDFSLGTNCQT